MGGIACIRPLTTHNHNHTHTHTTGSRCQRGSHHVPFLSGQGEEEVLKLLAKWERCIQGPLVQQQKLPCPEANPTKKKRKTSGAKHEEKLRPPDM